ncbi:cell wall-binding repeat-containing protein [Herbiconiux sp. P16]|uniref:cell wall-binding repeat-containing protein n=1 Tax=Herbiconiux wuyangfengii TaxID=3342794 RepID=UPI0035B81231
MRKLPSIAGAIALALLFASPAPLAATAASGQPQNQLVSISNTTPPVEGNKLSDQPSISADGRYVAFSSTASNLTGIDSGGYRQIYVRDTVSGATRMVSATPMGVAGVSQSFSPSISGDGRSLAYISYAANLVAGMTGVQVLLWSADSGTSEVVSVSNDVVPQMEDAGAVTVVLSADGSTVAWSTDSTNLTSEKTWGYTQIFERDLVGRTTTLVSRDTTVTPVAGAKGNADHPTISGDGHLIGFSVGWQLTSVAISHKAIYVRDRVNDTMKVASLNLAGTAGVNQDATNPALSGGGRYVAYSSSATDAVAQHVFGVATEIFVRDLQSNTTRLVSLDPSKTTPGENNSDGPSLSGDGTSLVFASLARNLVAEGGSFPVGVSQIYFADLQSGDATLISRETSSSRAGGADSVGPVVSSDGRRVSYSSIAANLLPEATGHDSQVFVRDSRESSSIERIGGADRYEVSAAISASMFSPGARNVFVASGEVFSDALSGSALAGAFPEVSGAPVLLVSKDRIPTAVAAELTRLHPKNIYVLGGEATIAPAVQTALQGFATSPVERIAGADRYAVSAGIAGRFQPGVPVAYVASGAVYPDALSGSAAAGLEKGPVLLVGKDGVPASVATELARLKPARIVVLGGVNSVSDAVVTTLQAAAPTTRIAGSDRYAVSAGISASKWAAGTTTVYISSGATFPDALSGSAAAIANKAPVLLVTANSVPDPVAAELQRLKPRHIVVLGGTNSVSDSVFNALKGYLAP